jgi:ferredoxin
VQCFNVGTAYSAWRAIAHGEPLVSRIVTVAGNVHEPRNYEVLIGTPMDELQLAPHPDTDRIMMGGPMMGFPTDVPVVKATNCLIDRLFPPKAPEMPCIRCGACAKACPHELQPFEMYWFSRAKNFGKTQEYHIFDCIECGCCSFVCPSHIPLVQYFRFAKSEIWARTRKECRRPGQDRFEFKQLREEREKAEKAEKLAKARRPGRQEGRRGCRSRAQPASPAGVPTRRHACCAIGRRCREGHQPPSGRHGTRQGPARSRPTEEYRATDAGTAACRRRDRSPPRRRQAGRARSVGQSGQRESRVMFAPAPFLLKDTSVSQVMTQVCIALVPGIAAYAWLVGPAILVQLVIATLAALLAEKRPCCASRQAAGHVPVRRLGHRHRLADRPLPAPRPWWLVVTGTLLAMVVAKQLYGGLGQNPFNPAMVAFA